MARLKGLGFELNTGTNEVEVTTLTGTASIQTTTVRSGTYALRSNPSASTGTVAYNFKPSSHVVFVRFYFRIATLPGSTLQIFKLDGLKINNVGLRLTSGGALQLYNFEDSAQVGSDSSALSTDTWYRIEVKQDSTTLSSTSVEALIDGTSFASGTINLASRATDVRFGLGQTGTADLFYDDIAINDDAGSFQNSWPGEGEIIHLRPNAAGDNTQWSPVSGNNFENVDEVTPDDVTTSVSETTSGEIDDYNLDATPAALASDDTISCVQVGVRFRYDTTIGTTPIFVVRIKASASGTVEESGNINPVNTTWFTNATAAPKNYPLTLYDLPGASTTAWTKPDLDTSQIGMRLTNTPSAAARVSTVWLLVDHKPAAVAPTATGRQIFLTTNPGFFGS